MVKASFGNKEHQSMEKLSATRMTDGIVGRGFELPASPDVVKELLDDEERPIIAGTQPMCRIDHPSEAAGVAWEVLLVKLRRYLDESAVARMRSSQVAGFVARSAVAVQQEHHASIRLGGSWDVVPDSVRDLRPVDELEARYFLGSHRLRSRNNGEQHGIENNDDSRLVICVADLHVQCLRSDWRVRSMLRCEEMRTLYPIRDRCPAAMRKQKAGLAPGLALHLFQSRAKTRPTVTSTCSTSWPPPSSSAQPSSCASQPQRFGPRPSSPWLPSSRSPWPSSRPSLPRSWPQPSSSATPS